jgi:hypothetical protein
MNTRIILLGLVLIVSVSVAGAAEITMHYSGTVTSTDANAVAIAEIEVGDSVTGQFTFDSDTPDEMPAVPLSGLYEAYSLTLAVHGFNYTASDNNISVANDSALFGEGLVDAFEIVTGLRDVIGPSLSELPPAQIDLVIVDTDATVFADDSLPTSLDISEFEISSEEPYGTTGGRLIFQSLATGGIGEVRFEINSIGTQSDGPPVLDGFTGIQIIGSSSNIITNLMAGDTVEFTVDAIDMDSGPLEYRFFVRAGYGEPDWGGNKWQIVQPYSPNDTVTHAFDVPGIYFLAGHVIHPGDTWAFGWPQSGIVVEVWPVQ